MTVFFVFLGLVLVGAATVCVVLLLALSAGPSCPACGGEALLVCLARRLRRVPLIERRWCTACGWEGLLRRGRWASERARAADRSSPHPV
jgi:predicted RNA-binding Zn-ribbon protein involved in translation (DUF1610 family)